MKLGRMRHLFAITIGCIDYLLCSIVTKNRDTLSYNISLILFSRANSP
jgi:hypothetical protein